MTLTTKRQTFFALANARGILSPAQHSDFLILQSKSVDFIALTETHLDPTTPDNFLCDPSWHLFRRDRNRHGGGVALFSRTTFSCKPRPDLSSANGEDLWIETSISAKKVLLAVIYRPPNQSAAELRTFLDNLELSLTKALRSTYTVILLGDFNARCTQWLPSAPSNTAGIELYNILESFSLHQLVDVITRPQGGQGLPSTAGSILDLVITNNPDLFTTPTVLSPLGNSDHLTVHFSLPLRTSNASGPTRRLWSLNNGNIHAFLRDLSDQPWPVRGSNDTLDKQWNDWLTLFLSSARRHIPSKVIRKVQRKPPWLSDYLLAECKLKKQLFNLCKSCPTEKNRERFRCQRNKVTALLRRAKKCFSTNLEKELHSKNSKSFWNFIRSCRGRSPPPIPSLETPEGTLATTDAEKADILNSFFIKQSDLPNRSDATESALSYSTASPAKLTSITVLPEDVLNILLQLNVKKAPGPDGIPNSLLKVSAPAISVSLAALFNNSLSSGQLPSAWKSGIVKPIHKRGSRNLPDHYRPITLLSNVSKVLEKIVNRHLYDHLISNKLLSSFQSGFRKGDSPSYQLFRLTHDLMSAIDDGKSAGGIFFDVRKAFDSVWHKCLLDKLALAGVSDCVYSWLRDYLTTRQQRVQVGYQFSQSLSPLAGVPQGSVLGPTLFLLYIDSVTSASPSPTNCFADDTSTIVVSSSPALVEEQLQAAADAIHLWASAHKLSIHPEKTVCMFFHHSRRPSYPLRLLLNGHSISQVRTHKHLGITFTSNLSWTEHIDSLISKSSTMIAILRHLRSNYHFSAAGLVRVYVSFVRPVLEYGSLAWCGLSASSSRRLESIQLKALAIAGCSPSRLQPLSTRRSAHLVRFFCRLLSDDVPSHLLNYCSWSSVGSVSSRSLRTSQCIRLPRPRTQMLLCSPLYQAASAYNSSVPTLS